MHMDIGAAEWRWLIGSDCSCDTDNSDENDCDDDEEEDDDNDRWWWLRWW